MNRPLVGMLLGLFDGARFVLSVLPTRLVLRLTSTLGGIAGKCCTRDTKISRSQLRYVFSEERHSSGEAFLPDGSDICVDTIAGNAFRHVGRAAGELLLWKRFVQQSSKSGRSEAIVGEGDEIIESIKRSGVGAVGLSAHLGSFELLAAYLVERGLRCSVLGRCPNYPWLEKFIRRVRKGYGVDVIWSNSPDAARRMITAVRSGRVLCALIDQDTKWNSEFSPFFGLDAASPIAPIQLAIRYKLPLFTSFIVRTSPLSHKVLTEPIVYSGEDAQASGVILRTYNERLETLIRSYPEQYIWWHRRWRRRPGVNYESSPQLLRSSRQYGEWLDILAETNEKKTARK